MRKQLRTPTPLPPPEERRRLREAAGLAGTNLAAQIGVSPTTVYGWEQGRNPSGLLREAYARALTQLVETTEREAGDDTNTADDHR
jgi:transcriptional regulator with XRE-family HTH domain